MRHARLARRRAGSRPDRRGDRFHRDRFVEVGASRLRRPYFIPLRQERLRAKLPSFQEGTSMTHLRLFDFRALGDDELPGAVAPREDIKPAVLAAKIVAVEA